MAVDAAETFDGIEEPRLAADGEIEAAVAVGHDVEPRGFLLGDDAGDRVEYCSRNSESPSADLNDRPARLRSNHSGRG